MNTHYLVAQAVAFPQLYPFLCSLGTTSEADPAHQLNSPVKVLCPDKKRGAGRCRDTLQPGPKSSLRGRDWGTGYKEAEEQ